MLAQSGKSCVPSYQQDAHARRATKFYDDPILLKLTHLSVAFKVFPSSSSRCLILYNFCAKPLVTLTLNLFTKGHLFLVLTAVAGRLDWLLDRRRPFVRARCAATPLPLLDALACHVAKVTSLPPTSVVGLIMLWRSCNLPANSRNG